MPRRRQVENVERSDRRQGAIRILEHYLERLHAGEVDGIMVVAELPGGAAELKQSASWNVAERLGRLDLLHDAVLRDAEDAEDDEAITG